VPAYVIYSETWDEARSKESAHNILIVKIEDKQYIVDVGFGYNSLRYPIEFIPETNSEIVVNDYEKYQIAFKGDHYILNMMIKG
jgi:arylamine N-acetyltransferase